jgi:hypothetical protein
MGSTDKVEREVAALGDLSRQELAALWIKVHGCSPPKGVKRGLLERSAAWQLQAKALGGLSPEARRTLKAAMRRVEAQIDTARSMKQAGTSVSEQALASLDGLATEAQANREWPGKQMVAEPTGTSAVTRGPLRSAQAIAKLPVVLSPGARLLREWNGRQHFVDVVEDGYVFDGKTYRSLSAVAKRITGAHWSGPRFFGL